MRQEGGTSEGSRREATKELYVPFAHTIHYSSKLDGPLQIFLGGDGKKNHTEQINEVNVMILDDQRISVLGKV